MKKSNNLFGRMAFLLFLMFSLAGYSQSCNYTLEMNDSWGDGWNGNTMSVYVNGNAVLSGVTMSGSSQSMAFAVNDGDNISTTWHGGGSYGYETSYRILDSNNLQVGAGAQSSISSLTASCAAPSGYCTPVPGSFQDTPGITSITVGATVYPISMPAYYQDLSGNPPVALQQGITANVSLSYGHTYGYNTFVWIDFGDDLVFDAGDLVTSVDASGNLDLSFTMPAGAPLGVHRMRIHGSDFGNAGADPCDSGNYMTAIDLDIEVIAPLCQQATIAGTEIVPDCDNLVPGYYVDVDISSGGDAQSITDGTNTWVINDLGVNTVGPFANGSTVNLTVVHADASCDINLGSFVYNCPPDNNDCDGAIAVGCGETYSGNTEFATIDDLDSCAGNTFGNRPGVWHTVVGTGGDIIIDTNDSSFDTKLALYSGSCGSLICLDSDDDGGVGTRSEITFSSNAGETYYVYVTGFFASSVGPYNLTVDCVCDVEISSGNCQSVYNSSFAPLASTELTATGLFGAGGFTYAWSDGQTGATISVNPTEDTVYQVTATDAAGCTSTAMTTVLVVDVSCSNGNGNQDKVTVCHNGEEICISPNAVQAHLNHGDTIGSCDGPAVSCDTPPLCDSLLKVPSPGAIDIPTTIEISWGQATGFVVGYVLSVGTTPGGTDVVDNLDVGLDLSYTLNGLDFNSVYYVTVVPYNANGSATGCDQSNSFTTVQSPWAADSTPINCSTGSITGNVLTDGYINDYLASCTGTINDAAGVWYSFEGTGDDIIVSTCGTPWDTYISVFEGDASSISCNGSDDDNFACSGFGTSSEYEFTSVVGTTYYIFVTSFSSFTNVGSGDFTLSLTCMAPPPPPQACVFAESISCGDTVTDTTVGFDVNDFDSCDFVSINTAPGRFYKVEGTGGDMIASLCGSSYDTKLAVFSGNCSGLVCVDANDDFCGTSSQVTFASQAGTIYYIYVTGWSSNAGQFTLNVSCPLPPEPLGGEVVCGTVLTQEYCYGNNESSSILYTSSNGSPLTLEFNSGIIEASTYDFLTIYDGVDASGTIVYQNGTSYGYNLSGDTATAPSGNMFVTIQTDGSVSCQSGSSSATTWYFNVNCGVAPIANNGGLGEWTMYPNPASNGEVELDLTNYLNSDLEIQMMDFSGKLLINKAESNLQNPRYRMNTQNVSNGLYFVRVVTESGISIKKLIIAN
ncbi:T9SS type A sorting domain-containing protein [Xanthomarina spongicola]|uniref:Putative secreted protein (Por secretion system target) n=1 Tax=Xanthomarina spongicola TaxID=570520 RepID=A0A316DH86_9FLAO|nr:T9SS type A sorting domain-containing protein [Xanthomarina spongicola]PWK17541.1 putative secreted protein (Por secretion system target) [Xanthomarina spongicola]